MNERIKELMLEAGYAAPELAGRANKLVELVVEECAQRAEAYAYMSPNFNALAEELRRIIGVEE
jgi:hypothetical protein